MIFIIVASILFLDQFTKFLLIRNLSLNQSIPIIKNFFYFTLTHNRGAAFGILNNYVPLFIITSLITIALLFMSLKKNKTKKINLYSLSLSLILGGALGNLIDRVSLGYVIDFLDLRIWPVFNLADSAITVGAVLLGYSILFKDKCIQSSVK